MLGVNTPELERHSTGIGELDILLGGQSHPGVVNGHALLLVGNPGAGKSTLLLQILGFATKPLCLSGEQPEEEIAARAREIGIEPGRIRFDADLELSSIERIVAEYEPSDVMIDSIACCYSHGGSQPGSAWAIKEAAHRLFDLAHSTKSTLWIVGHVNAKGRASGPMAAIHWVDVLLGYDTQSATRRLYFPSPVKNRGGPATGQVFFTMSQKGVAPCEPSVSTSKDTHSLSPRT